MSQKLNLKPVLGSQLRSGHPLAKGMTGCWLMNEGSGNKVYDSSGNIDLTFGVGTAAPAWKSGNFGFSLLFNDAQSQYIEKDQAILTNYPLTIVAWAMSDDDAQIGTIVWIGDKDDSKQMCGIRMDGSGVGNPVDAYSYHTVFKKASYAGFTVNKWHQIVGVFTSQTSRSVYLDGKFGATNTEDPGELPGWDRTCIGAIRSSAPVGHFSGKIGHVFIFNRALSAAEIAWLYREPFAMFDRPSIGLFYVPPAAGQTILDYERGHRGVARGVMVGAA